MDIKEIEKSLYNIPLFGKKIGLLNIERILDELKDYVNIVNLFENSKIIHVTGTNGKGSVCRMLSGIYTEAGYSVGMFTSPHINHITERVRINNENVEESLFLEGYKVLSEIADRLKKEGLVTTFFEWVFGIGLYCFAKLEPEILIVEVGIGGRLDTTNILPRKDLAVITSVGLDHQEILGNTIEAIADEKAGIIKENCRVVLYNESEAVTKRVNKVVKSCQCQSYYKVFPKTVKILETSHLGIDFSIDTKYYYYEKLRLPVVALYQLDNASIALACIEAMQLLLPLHSEDVIKGLEKFKWPGRFESIKEGFIIDGAHNPLGLKSLIDSCNQMFKQNKPDLLIGIKEGKSVNEMLELLTSSQGFDRIYVVDLTIQKSVPKELIVKKLKDTYTHVQAVKDLSEFLKSYKFNHDKYLIGAGSLYLMSEIRKIVLENK